MFGLKTVTVAILLHPCLAFPTLSTRQTTTPYTSLGCFIDDGGNNRALSGISFDDNSATIESCASFCSAYDLFGLEYGSQCWCGNSCVAPSCTPTASTDCSFPCAGDNSEICGAGNRLSLYSNTPSTTTTSSSVGTSGWAYEGCYVDSGNPRVLPDNLLGDNSMTPTMCEGNCAGYAFFGLEYGRECWCGNTLPPTPALESSCSFPCAGDDTSFCGAGGLMDVYMAAPISSSSSSTSSSTSAAVSSSTSVSSSISSVAPSISSSTASATSLSSSSPVTIPPAQLTAPPVCNGDNCLNELRDNRFSASASAFCQTYTTTINTDPAAIPTYLENCQLSPSQVSSACTCLLYTPPATSSAAPTLSSSSPSSAISTLSAAASSSTSTLSTAAPSSTSSTLSAAASSSTSSSSSFSSTSTSSTSSSTPTPTVIPTCGNLILDPSFESISPTVSQSASGFTAGNWIFTGYEVSVQWNHQFCSSCIETPYGSSIAIFSPHGTSALINTNSISQVVSTLSSGFPYVLTYHYFIWMLMEETSCSITTTVNGITVDVFTFVSVTSASGYQGGAGGSYPARTINFLAPANTATIEFSQTCTEPAYEINAQEVTFFDEISLEVVDSTYCSL